LVVVLVLLLLLLLFTSLIQEGIFNISMALF
jgi:hypothetical protein